MEDRNYKLKVIWNCQDTAEKFVFLDDSEQYFLPKLKLEKTGDKKYELLYTTSDIYRPVEDVLVDYAYNNSLKELSNILSYSDMFDKVERLMNDDSVPEKVLKVNQERLDILKNKTQTHINEIKSNYVNKQRKNSEAIQEV
jgi:hypothetical protein